MVRITTNLLSSSVMSAMMKAAASAKVNQTCTGLYQKAKLSGDEGAAERAQGFAVSSREEALAATEKAREALTERVQEVREEERLEQAQLLEEQSAQAAGEMHHAAVLTGDSAAQPAAVVELSQEYLDSVQSAAPDAQPAQGEAPAAPGAGSHVADGPRGGSQGKAAAAVAARRNFSMDIMV